MRFATRSGVLTVSRSGVELALDLPARPPRAVAHDPSFAAALGAAPAEVYTTGELLAVFDSAAEVASLAPDFRAVAALEHRAVIATAPGDGAFDFVSRFFAPSCGVDEDPVTGSAHTVLTPYWAKRLGREQLLARQISTRGGDVACTLVGDRVRLAGEAHTYLSGTIRVAD